jgi:hypothetical protein
VIARYEVSFHGERPETVAVGDKLEIRGTVTVRSISSELVDITVLGQDPEFSLGEITIELVANRLEVEAEV